MLVSLSSYRPDGYSTLTALGSTPAVSDSTSGECQDFRRLHGASGDMYTME